jgi:tubulin-specific chaperone E
MPAALEPGWRVELAGSRGTVRFVGALPGRGDAAVWVGVDWDDPARGKHDGTLDGVRHFSTAHATSGSFVKASKLGDGNRRSLLDAVALRHAAAAAAPGAARALPETVGGVGGRTEFAGVDAAADHQARVRDATALTVRGMGACRVGDAAALADLLASVRSLDVAESLVSDVGDILTLLRTLPALRTLDLSKNRFHLVAGEADALRAAGAAPGAAPSLRTLVLNQCNLPWSAVLAVCRACPSLEELRLHRCGLPPLAHLTDLTPSDALAELRLLDLDGNALSWPDILSSFGRLPALESLFVGSNRIGTIRFGGRAGGGASAEPHFPKLSTLSLTGNAIEDWRSISELCVLPSLRSLRALDVPVLAEEEHGGLGRAAETAVSRDGVIARLGTLRVLDGSTIYSDERVYAERRYMRSVLLQIPGAAVPPAVLKEHPRILELCEEYDVVLGGRDGGASSTSAAAAAAAAASRHKTLRADLVHCSFVNCGGFRDGAKEFAKVQLPVGVSLGKLTGLAARLFGGASASDVAWLRLVDNAGEAGERLLDRDDDPRDLRHYGVEGGHAVCLNVRGRHER